jgi:N-ethylmaleimide reductase
MAVALKIDAVLYLMPQLQLHWKEKTGIRLSPYGVASDMPHYPEIHETYDYLTKELNKLDIAYIHLVDHSAMGAPAVPREIKKLIRHNFKNTLILWWL